MTITLNSHRAMIVLAVAVAVSSFSACAAVDRYAPFDELYGDIVSEARQEGGERLGEVADQLFEAMQLADKDSQMRTALLLNALDLLLDVKGSEKKISQQVHSSLARYTDLDEKAIRVFIIDSLQKRLSREKDFEKICAQSFLAGLQNLELAHSLLLAGHNREAAKYRNRIRKWGEPVGNILLLELGENEVAFAKDFDHKCIPAKGDASNFEGNYLASRMLFYDESVLERYWFQGTGNENILNPRAAFLFVLEHCFRPAMPYMVNSRNENLIGLAGFFDLLADETLFVPDNNTGDAGGAEAAEPVVWLQRIADNLRRLSAKDLLCFARMMQFVYDNAPTSGRMDDLYNQANRYVFQALFQKVDDEQNPAELGIDKLKLNKIINDMADKANTPQVARNSGRKHIMLTYSGCQRLNVSRATSGRQILPPDFEITMLVNLFLEKEGARALRRFSFGDVGIVFRKQLNRSPIVSVMMPGKNTMEYEFSDYRSDKNGRLVIGIVHGRMYLSLYGKKIFKGVNVEVKSKQAPHDDDWEPYFNLNMGNQGKVYFALMRVFDPGSLKEQ